ncbi:hypothetical protein [Kitasatospora sp. NPDC050463]|uniref:hypothetical protein n=1 Tax=Kitasatospora sp. NPDC050463 TaxID=3155786 RepID=UPI00341144D7
MLGNAQHHAEGHGSYLHTDCGLPDVAVSWTFKPYVLDGQVDRVVVVHRVDSGPEFCGGLGTNGRTAWGCAEVEGAYGLKRRLYGPFTRG